MKYNIPWGGWAIAEKDWDFIKDIIQKQEIKTVLEFGTGLSTLLISEIAKIDTFETNKEWVETIRTKAPNGNVRFHLWNGQDPPEIETGYDLAFVDGPAGKFMGGPGREMSMRVASKYADKIIVHDAGREDEEELQGRILGSKFHFISQSDEHRIRCNYWEKRPFATHI